MMYEGWAPEAVDWDAEREPCRYCGLPLHERGGKTRFGYRCSNSGHRCNARHGGALERCDLRVRDCRALKQHEREERLGVRPEPTKLTALDVEKAIRERHRNQPGQATEWLILTEVGLANRRVDVMAVRLWTSRGYEIHAYEVKVDRQDLLNELRDPSKREPGIDASTQFWFATPVGLMDPAEVPDDCGLIEVGRHPRGARSKLKYRTAAVVDAPKRRLDCVRPQMLFHVAWRLRDLQDTLKSRGIVV